ncbi:hypothetical protein JW721_03635 [Candidatus Micrarchaeota archaeon]|nr:hypothetical protein [Candidatus Micrarchaeota archaeon]
MREEGITGKVGEAAGGILKGGVGAAGGVVSWIGGLILLFGAYSIIGGGDFSLAIIGAGAVCMGEMLIFLKGLSKKQKEALEEGIVGELLKGMAFPVLWLAIYYLSGMGLILAFAFSTGVSAIIRSARITASFYTS